MTLDDIRDRDARTFVTGTTPETRADDQAWAWIDRHALLAEVDRLSKDLRGASAAAAARVEGKRQRDPCSDPDDYWTGWNDALDAALAAIKETP